MQNLYCDIENIHNESDVEQKFLYKFLSSDFPIGLNFSEAEIDTKKSIKAYTINKGKSQKTYIPDYIISVSGIPLVIVEAKAPDVQLDEAFAEAQLYAGQINNQFAHKINPCKHIIVSNSIETWFGYYDSDTPETIMKFDDFKVDNFLFCKVRDSYSKPTLSLIPNEIYKKDRANAFYKSPVASFGGKRAINEELISNDFGNALISDYRSIFDPDTEEDRFNIVKNAYVISKKREQHIEPIYREIKKIKVPSLKDTTLLSTDEAKELINQVQIQIETKEQQCPLILLIGNRGSGKTTFIRYFKEKIVDTSYEKLSEQCEWCFLDMNYAPIDSKEIYDWIKENIVESIKKSHKLKIDFDTKEFLEKLYKKEIDDFKKGEGKFIENDLALYNKEIYKLIVNAKSDKDKTLKAFVNYLRTNEHKIPIIVFDNCDKKDKDKQLLMFEVAQWVRKQFKCIVMLPMRDITYDVYKDYPPLDTFVRDLVFRIDPPDLLKVLMKRLEYIERLNKTNPDAHYTLENSIRVKIKPQELIDYYRQIVHVIRNDDWAKDIFYRLTNRDIRGAIQLFEDLCRSGHINTSEIFSIRIFGAKHELHSYKIMNALLRKNRKFYNEANSNFVNLFASDFQDDFPDPLARLDILFWLKNRKATLGINNTMGFHKIQTLLKEVQLFGHKESILLREINLLAQKGLILTENQNEQVSDEDLIKISPSGSLHVNLLKNVSYLAACAEAVMYRNTDVMDNIAKRLKTNNYLDLSNQILTAGDMLNYLSEYRKRYFSNPEIYLKKDVIFNNYNLQSSIDYIEGIKSFKKEQEELFNQTIEGEVVYAQKNSILITFNQNKGFLAVNEALYNLSEAQYNEIKVGDRLQCRVLSYDDLYNSYRLMFIKKM